MAFEKAMTEYNSWVDWVDGLPTELFGAVKSSQEFAALEDEIGNYLFPVPSKIVSDKELEAYIKNGLDDPYLGDY